MKHQERRGEFAARAQFLPVARVVVVVGDRMMEAGSGDLEHHLQVINSQICSKSNLSLPWQGEKETAKGGIARRERRKG